MDLIDEVESDLSVFHRVEEWRSMPGPRFCRLVSLLPAYGGAVARALAAAAAQEPDPQLPAASAVRQPTPISPAVAAMSPHADLFSFATSGGGGV